MTPLHTAESSLNQINFLENNLTVSIRSLKNVTTLGLPWWFSGEDSTFPMQGAWVQPLVRELNPTCRNY